MKLALDNMVTPGQTGGSSLLPASLDHSLTDLENALPKSTIDNLNKAVSYS